MSIFSLKLPIFEKSINRLEEVLLIEKNSIVRDSAIKRFEITSDIAWKTLKEYLDEKYGILVRSPKSAFREAFSQSIIEYNDIWLEMIDSRNDTAHDYDESKADEVYYRIPDYAKSLRVLIEKLKA